MEQIVGTGVEGTEHKEPVGSALIRHVAAHAQYEAALLFTRGQYILYHRRGREIVCKGVSAGTLRAAFVEEPVDSGWLPEGVVRWGSGPAGTFMVKFIPPGKQEIHLSTNNPTEPLIIVPPLPAMLFAGVNRTYYVWAQREKTYDPTAHLYHAPLPNLYDDGSVCFGINHPPVVGWKTINAAWQLFLTSPFNSHMAGGRSQAFADVRQQLVTLAKANARRYPVQDLTSLVVGQRYMTHNKELRTLNEMVNHYLLMRKDDE